MSSPEIAQSESDIGRRTVDGVLVGFIVAVAAFVALGGTGVL